jgi:3'-phosphoadenosine 5'-phosphosulfate sulfotransferase (PAPS reductase)/FAD synthetase
MTELPVVDAPVSAPAHEILPLDAYDRVIVAFSGGKDSIACISAVLAAGVPKEKMRLWHQHVDGDPGTDEPFMDWPCTGGYCRAVGAALGIPVRFQWKQGGFKREMLRENALTAPTSFELEDGGIDVGGGVRGKRSTRRKFPQVSADLKVRWCSAYLKIDVAALALNNDPDYQFGNFLFVSGERRQESAARAKYAASEPHRTNKAIRRVDHWRPVIDWSEEEVWAAMRALRVVPHPGYRLGWSRLSCLACIFGNESQWASIRLIDPDRFNRIAELEREFGLTIRRGKSVVEMADAGTPYAAASDSALVAAALSRHYTLPVRVENESDWTLPAGAYGHSGGPT